jgi:hypothetical protein
VTFASRHAGAVGIVASCRGRCVPLPCGPGPLSHPRFDPPLPTFIPRPAHRCAGVLLENSQSRTARPASSSETVGYCSSGLLLGNRRVLLVRPPPRKALSRGLPCCGEAPSGGCCEIVRGVPSLSKPPRLGSRPHFARGRVTSRGLEHARSPPYPRDVESEGLAATGSSDQLGREATLKRINAHVGSLRSRGVLGGEQGCGTGGRQGCGTRGGQGWRAGLRGARRAGLAGEVAKLRRRRRP